MSLPYYPYRYQTFLMAIITWFIFFCFIIWFEPSFVKDVGLSGFYLPFFLLLFSSLNWLILSLTGRWKRTLLWASVITTLFWLRINHLDSFLNLILLGSFTGIWEYYWSLIHKPPILTSK